MSDSPDPTRIATRLDFGRELTLARERSGLTVRELGHAAGVPPATVNGYLTGKNLPALHPGDRLRRILVACGITEPETLERWEQALRRARRAAGDFASPTSTVDDLPPARTAATPAAAITPPVEATAWLASIRPPVDRLDQGPVVRGRDDLLDRLGGWLAGTGSPSPGTIVLHGLGGVGKTTAALALARRARAQGRVVWWVSAADSDALVSGMQALAGELGASYDQIRTGSSPDLVWRLLEEYDRPWLLVIDNADPPERLAVRGSHVGDGNGWIRRIHNGLGRCLVTSDDGSPAAWGAQGGSPWLELVAVRPLATKDGAEVLAGLAGPAAGSLAEAGHLAERLGGLGLALQLAGRHIAESAAIPDAFAEPDAARTFAAYLQALDDGRHTELPGPGEVARTWELSLDLLAKRDLPMARSVLLLLACLGPAPVSCSLLRWEVLSASPLVGPVTGRVVWEVLQSLHGLGVIELVPGDGDPMVVTHRLVREVTRRGPQVRGRLAGYLALVTDVLTAGVSELDPRNPRSWARWQALADHSTAALDLAHELGAAASAVPPAAYRVAAQWARYLHAAGELARAEAAYTRVWRLATAALGPTDPRVMEIEHNQGRLAYDLGRFDTATRVLQVVLRKRSEQLGPGHPDTLTTQHYLGRTLRDHGKINEAFRLFRKTLDARRALLGDEHPDTLTSRNNVADALRALGHLDRARDELLEVLRLRTAVLGAEHPATLVTRYNLARLAHDAEDLDGARLQLEELLATYERVLSPDHPRALLTRQALVDALHDLGELERAESLVRDLLARRGALLGPSHPATLITRHRLALILVDRRRFAEAEAELVEVLAARRGLLGNGHPDTTRARETLDALRRRGS